MTLSSAVSSMCYSGVRYINQDNFICVSLLLSDLVDAVIAVVSVVVFQVVAVYVCLQVFWLSGVSTEQEEENHYSDQDPGKQICWFARCLLHFLKPWVAGKTASMSECVGRVV